MDHISIIDLPEEVIVMIVRRLDFPSLCNMYNSCKHFRNMLSLHGVVLECHMSANLVATVNTLKLNFFKDISNHLLVLNMCGVQDLTKTKVLPAFRKLKRLKVLDISYTNLNIPNLIAIHRACPTLNDITINYKFGPGRVMITENALQQYQSLFEHFKNVHFMGSLENLLSSLLVLHILKKSKLDKLQFSVVEVDHPCTTVVTNTDTECQTPHFSHFAAYLLVNWRGGRRLDETPNHFPVISQMQLKKYEFCVIYTLKHRRHMPYVYATPLFKKFFSDHLNVDIRSTKDYESEAKGNVALLVWNKESTQFDKRFFEKLYSHLKPYFPFYYKTLSEVTCPKNYDWIFINPGPSHLSTNSDAIQEKKRKTSMSCIEFDYDNLLKNKDKVQISIIFAPDLIASASLPSDGQYFGKLTFLSLSGAIKYNTDFFLKLFQCCHNLVTLSVELSAITSGRNAYEILYGMQQSQSMKNFRLVDKGMDLKLFFELLSNCKTLENIILIDPKQWNHCDIVNPYLLIEPCAKLYSIFIEAPFTGAAQKKQLDWFNHVKVLCKRPHLRVVINRVFNNICYYGYDPFVTVFKLNSIKPI